MAYRRDTISYHSPFLLQTFNMPYALLLSLFFHLFQLPHTSSSKQCLHKKRVKFLCSHLFIGTTDRFLDYMRPAGTGDRWTECFSVRVEISPVGRGGQTPEPFLWTVSVSYTYRLSPRSFISLLVSHFLPLRQLYFTPGSIQERKSFQNYIAGLCVHLCTTVNVRETAWAGISGKFLMSRLDCSRCRRTLGLSGQSEKGKGCNTKR